MSATFSFACQCGARLQARPEMTGKKGKCKFCGATFVIPVPPPAKPAEPKPAGKTADAPARQAPEPVKEQVCSICQTAIQPGEPAAPCNSCGLPFHVECWTANFGCATYGCKNVNILKPGPDIAIGQAAIAGAELQPWQTQTQQQPAAAGLSKQDIPWDYILLAAAAVAGLLSCVMCGVPSLCVAAAATYYMTNTAKPNMNILIAVWIIVGITFILGMMSSGLLFLAGE